MGIVANLLEQRFHPKQEPPEWFTALTGYDTAAGLTVNPETAMNYSAVFGCVRILAETTASLPLQVYKRLSPRGKEKTPDHYLYPILHDSPNSEMTAMEFREALQGHLALWGNAFSEIEFNGAGEVSALWPLRPDKMRVKRENGRLFYYYRLPEGFLEARLPAERVLHLRGLSSNGITGYSVVSLARQSIGLGLATEEFGSRFFGNGAEPGGVLRHPGKLSTDAHKRMAASWEEAHKGLDRSHRIAILEEGVQYDRVGVPPEDAQFLETRKFQVQEIARWFRIQPHMLADLDRATFNNIEELGLEFVIYTLNAWLVRWEQRLKLSLLTAAERETYFIEHLVNGLLRGDILKRYQAYSMGRQWGWMSANDVREKENENPLPGGQGDIYMVPLNMIAADQITSAEPAGAGMRQARDRHLPDPENRAKNLARTRYRLARSYERIYKDTAARILRREINDVRNAANKFLGQRDYGQFSIWLSEFYREHLQFIFRQMAPVNTSYGEAVSAEAQEEIGEETGMTPELERFIRSYTDGYAAKHAGISEDSLRRAVQQALDDGNLDPLEQIDAELAGWEDKRSSEIAMEESTRFGNAIALTVYILAGVQKIVSVAHGKNCPYCDELNGKVIGVHQYFLSAGQEFKPDGADKPLVSSNSKRHPPYHKGCDCTILSSK